MISLADTLDRVLPRTAPDLVSRAVGERLRVVAREIPAALSDWLYLEFGLDAASERVDLIVRVTAERRALLAPGHPVQPFGDRLRAHPLWARVQALARAWTDPAGPLDSTVSGIWLEFDLDPDRAPETAPGVFVDFTRAAFTTGSAAARAALAEAAVAPLVRQPRPAASVGALRRCFTALPSAASVPYVGVLLPRGDDVVRVCVSGLDAPDIGPYLAAVRWPGPPDELHDVVRSLREEAHGPLPIIALLHLDVGTHVQPRIGVEFAFDRRSQVRGAVDELGFLDALVARSLCAPASRDVLVRWPGCTTARMRHELWPSVVMRRLNHVKVQYTPGAPLQVKGYLCVAHRYWRARSGALPARPPTDSSIE
ncbi:hypothetical protein tb265_49720 [Gemmatimonadetes bacterium T265]|nr:hypothetical protein tb265_49720 [Gemmatimonadetes bacterium T265]